MKRVQLTRWTVVCLLSVNLASAQSQEGVITYESTIDLQQNMPVKQEDNMKRIVPGTRTSKKQLFFNANESLYKHVEEEEEEFGGGGIRVRFGSPDREIYTDRVKARRLTQQELMGKNYLIEDSLKVAPWKFGTETKTILGYECRQAYYTDESHDRKQEITAWYTDRIRPFLGPEIFNSLPGTVLAVDVNNGERVIIATNIDLRPLKKSELKEPKFGERTTPEEFRKIMDEQMEQMRRNGKNRMMIR